jgi:hypothetical protein
VAQVVLDTRKIHARQCGAKSAAHTVVRVRTCLPSLLNNMQGSNRQWKTDARILGAIAKLLPELFSLQSVQKIIKKDAGGELKAVSAARSYERISTVTVPPNQGNPETPYKFEKPNWHEMRDGITIPSIAFLLMPHQAPRRF